MKKIVFGVLVLFIAFLISCGGDSASEAEYPDENQPDGDVSEVTEAEEEAVDEDVVEEADETVADEEPEQPEEELAEPTEPQIDPIGNFNLNFSGQINTTISTSSRGGTGVANFNYNGMPFTFQEISVLISIFPLAMVNSGNIIVLWLDSFSAGDLQGTVDKQVFGISFPQNAGTGSGTMKELGSYAFYGDITVNITGGQFNIKCVRAVSDSGEYTINSNDGANIAFLANGDLFDPSLAGSMIPYPACE